MSLRRARRRDLRLLPVVALAWCAAAAAILQPSLAVWLGGGAFAASLGLLWLATRRTGTARTVAALLAIGCACGGVAAAHTAFAGPERARASQVPVDGGRSLVVEARVVGKVERVGRGWGFDAVTEALTIGQVRHTVAVPVVVRISDIVAELDLGAAVTVSGTAFAADPGERAVLVVQASGEPQVTAPPGGVLAVASALRRGLHAAVDELPQPAAGLIAGLSVGDTSAVTTDLDAVMKASSLSHLTAVSGANCALVVGIAYGLAALTGARRGVRVGAGALTLVGFVILVSPEPSVVRAATMAVVAMCGLLLGRIGAGVSVLCIAVVVLLAFDPWLALSLGFALSSAATGALLLLAGPLADGLSRWMPGPLALALSVPLAAQLACGPLIVLISPTVPVYGVLANLLAGPAAPAGTVLGLLACVATPLPLLAQGFAAMAWLPAAWVAATATQTALLPGSRAPWLEGPVGLVTLVVVGAAVATLIVPAARQRPRVRLASAMLVATTVGVLLAVGPLAGIVERLRTPSAWAVAACDVGQGDAVLVRSAGRVALIDTGPDPGALSACLERFGVDRIDLLVLTHFDLDHRGGVPAVAGRVDFALHGPIPDATATAVLRTLTANGARTVAAHEGMHGRLGDAAWRVAWPPSSSRAYAGNDASIVWEIEGGGVPRSVFLGDLSASPQASLTTRLSGGYDLVKVAHHGSADQHDALYTRIAARLALVTVGENTYGHPRAEILDLLSGAGTRVVRTDLSGAIAVWAEDGNLRLWQEHGVGAAR